MWLARGICYHAAVLKINEPGVNVRRLILMLLLSSGLLPAAHARHPQCPALLTDGECDQLVAIMATREKQPEEYSRRIVEFARVEARP